MILLIGLIWSLYGIFIILPVPLYNHHLSNKVLFIKRVTLLLLSVYFLYLIEFFFNYFHIIINNFQLYYFDGLCLITLPLLFYELFIILFVLILLLSVPMGFKSEIYLIIICNLIGGILILNSHDFIITFVSWELFNYTLYLLTTIYTLNGNSLSAGIKYFILSCFTTTLLGLGICILYLYSGSTNYSSIFVYLSLLDSELTPIYLGSLLISITLFFKLSLSPFHTWGPDLYSNLPTYITLYLISVPKLFLFYLLFILFPLFSQFLLPFFYFVSLFSFLIGSFTLPHIWNFKRFIAFSSISHLGLIVALLPDFNYFTFYLIIYLLTTLNFLFIILSLPFPINYISDLNGLFHFNYTLFICLILSLFSLAGIPPFAGFFGKYWGYFSLFTHCSYTLLFIGIICSFISCSYYLNLITSFTLYLNVSHPTYSLVISPLYSYLISTITLFLIFFVFFSDTLLFFLNLLIT